MSKKLNTDRIIARFPVFHENRGVRSSFFTSVKNEDLGSGQQGRNLVGESSTVSIDRLGHVAIPQFGRVIVCPFRGVNGLAALCSHKVGLAVVAIGGPSE